MNEIQSIFQQLQLVANDMYGKYVDAQHAQLAPEQAHTNALMAQHADALHSIRTLFQDHGFDIATTPYVLPELQRVTFNQIEPARTVFGFNQVWHQLLHQYVKQDPTPYFHAQHQQINTELSQAIEQLQHDYARFAHVFADTYFVASLHVYINLPTTPEMLLWQMMSSHPPMDMPSGTCTIAIPHPALLQWRLHQAEPGSHAHILAWYITQPNNRIDDYMDVLAHVFAPTTTRNQQTVLYDQWPTELFNAASWRPIELPSTTVITAKNERQRTRKFGNLSANSYTFAYGFIPNEYSQEHGYESEDTLLFEVDNQDFIIIVSDGVSQSAMGRIGAFSVTQMLHVVWQELKQSAGAYDESFLKATIKRALYAAKIDANIKVSRRLYSDEFKASVSERIWRVLDSLFTGGGTQSTFSCVFRIGDVLYAISMGNSGIFIQGQQSGIVLHPDDDRFKSDGIRFSSGERTGMRGEPFVSIYPTFLADNQRWRVVIHSDALAEYKERTSLYQQPLERPFGRPLNLDDDLLTACITVDDTTIIELYCGT